MRAGITCLLFLILTGCASTALVTDTRNFQTRISDIELEKSPYVRVLHGDAVLDLSLDKISSITVFPDESRTFSGKLYYRAKIDLTDGTTLSSTSPASAVRGVTYLHVGDYLTGQSEAGPYRISLTDVSRVVFE